MKILSPEQCGICWRCDKIKYIDEGLYTCEKGQYSVYGTDKAEHCIFRHFIDGTDIEEIKKAR